MNLLLDTHIWLWFQTENPKLSPRLIDAIVSSDSKVFVSTMSLFELKIKERLNKISVHPNLENRSIENGIQFLSTELEDFAPLQHLPKHHGDPFDLALMSQAINRKLILVTADSQMSRYKDVEELFLMLN